MEMVVEDEIQKRNTDCVYFLASPLTCKKGVECEYRHSEGARLNPRDCYYWLAGNCLNPTCTFRHPPLDGRPENSTEPSDLQHQSSVPVNKTSVPCYFFFNGFCNKGDRCTFLHGPNGVSSTPKIPKAIPKVNGVHYPENKASGNDAVPAVIEAPPNPSRTDSQLPKAIPTNGFHHLENKTSVSDTVPSVILAPSSGPNPSRTVSKAVLNMSETKDDVELSVPNNVERSPSVEISEPDSEEAADKSDTPLPAEDFIDTRAVLSPEQSSEEQAEEDQIEREEWWESSPGLDVLVDNGSEDYEDNPEYLPVHDREARRLHEHLLQYDYEDPVGYDPMEYQGAGMLYEDGGIYDLYDGVEDDHISDYVRGNPNPSMERSLDPMIFPKRKFLPREMEGNGRSGVDLRDHLKRRRVDTRQTFHEPRRRGPVYLNDRNQERPRRRDMGNHPRRRLASEVRNNLTGLDMDRESELNVMHRRNRLRHPEPKSNRPRPRERERRQQSRPLFLPSEISRGPTSKEMRSTQESTLLMRSTRESTVFSGPKTLAQIKEEKRKARVNEDSFGNTRHQSRTTPKDFEEEKRKSRGNEDSFGNTRHQSRATPKDFEGPKPLSEILKEKRRMGSMSDDSSSTRSKRDHVDHERNHDDDYFDEDGNDFIDEYEDDEDGLEKKIASIFS